MMPINSFEKVWPEWHMEQQLGKGAFGVVYQAVRREHTVESHAAIKVISIPADVSEVDSLRSDGLGPDAAKTYLQGLVSDFVGEIRMMESLKGTQNIVSVEDYKVVEREGEIGWDIYIRMELLTPFNTYASDRKLTEAEVIKLGCDICTALEMCGKRNIIHRDIKPENIFVNDFGDFKLGDFGIARKLENTTGGLSQKGTFNYMAPEVVNGTAYDARVDTYSLGIVLYRLLNGNRLPFLDDEQKLLSPAERKNAVERRIRGEALPDPRDATPQMANLILRACAHDPKWRFASATEMKEALNSVTNGTYRAVPRDYIQPPKGQPPENDGERTVLLRDAAAVSGRQNAQTQAQAKTLPQIQPLPPQGAKSPKGWKVILAVILVLAIGGAALALFLSGKGALMPPEGKLESSLPQSDLPETENRQPTPAAITYVLNIDTKKFHKPECPSAKEIADHNRQEVTWSREECIAGKYDPCKKCNP